MKKFLLFIVEGKNDSREIHAIIRAACGDIFLNNYVDEYLIHNGDITTEADSNEKTIVGKLNKIVVSWRNGGGHPFQKISPSDIERIIHIIDMDGAFIPDSSIIETDDDRAQYFDDSIHYYNRSQLVGRNHKKAKVIRKLLEVHQVDNIPYSIYFASCNMDHLLFDQRNPMPNDKTSNAFRFASECKGKEYLSNTIFSPQIGTTGSFAESWEMIQQSNNSLNRYTNLNIFLNSIIG